jgi:2,3-bisphosphoglycerate-independent phosphoglycerate mutase
MPNTMSNSGESKSVCLVVIDGWGVSGHSSASSDAILNAKTPVMTEFLTKGYPNVNLDAHGLAVGLPKGLMGNSEVGHLNLGAGRVVYQDIVRIDEEIESGRMERENPVLSSIFNYCLTGNRRLHFIGLCSDGGVHSHLRHLKALLKISQNRLKDHSVSTFVHAITDGRDTAPCSAKSYLIDDLIPFLRGDGNGECFAKLGSVCGRYYAMDRDKRLERTDLAYKAITQEGENPIYNESDLEKVL